MRLVHYYPRALVGDGGPTRAMWEWANAAHAAGCEVLVLYDAGLEAESAFRNPAIRTIPLAHTGVGRFQAARGLSGALRPDDVLILHSAYLPGNVAVALAAMRCASSTTSSCRTAATTSRPGTGGITGNRRGCPSSVRISSGRWRSMCSSRARCATSGRWRQRPAGSSRPLASRVPAERWDGGTGGYLAWIGRYDIQTKGLDLLVEAMSHLPTADRRPLRLHGKRSEGSPEDLKSIARELGLADQVNVGEFLPESREGRVPEPRSGVCTSFPVGVAQPRARRGPGVRHTQRGIGVLHHCTRAARGRCGRHRRADTQRHRARNIHGPSPFAGVFGSSGSIRAQEADLERDRR